MAPFCRHAVLACLRSCFSKKSTTGFYCIHCIFLHVWDPTFPRSITGITGISGFTAFIACMAQYSPLFRGNIMFLACSRSKKSITGLYNCIHCSLVSFAYFCTHCSLVSIASTTFCFCSLVSIAYFCIHCSLVSIASTTFCFCMCDWFLLHVHSLHFFLRVWHSVLRKCYHVFIIFEIQNHGHLP